MVRVGSSISDRTAVHVRQLSAQVTAAKSVTSFDETHTEMSCAFSSMKNK